MTLDLTLFNASLTVLIMFIRNNIPTAGLPDEHPVPMATMA
jgi:hypothetical protein